YALYPSAPSPPPFPTRRPSDLPRAPGFERIPAERDRHLRLPRQEAGRPVPEIRVRDQPDRRREGEVRRGQRRGVRRGCGDASLRSEEHTSELQSHLNLVCRLLL